MTVLWFAGGVVFGLLLAETRLSRRHEAGLHARGATAPPGDVYLAMAVVYPLAFLAMLAEGLMRLSAEGDAASRLPGEPSWFASGVVMFAAAKALKYWAIGALGDRWSFRVWIEPEVPLVERGPYRYVAHPNYVAVVGELVGVALMAGAVVTGPVAVGLFMILLVLRIRFEERALRDAGLWRR